MPPTLGKKENEGYEFLYFGAGAGDGRGGLSLKLGHSVSLFQGLRISFAFFGRENKEYLPGIVFDPDLQIGCEFARS